MDENGQVEPMSRDLERDELLVRVQELEQALSEAQRKLGEMETDRNRWREIATLDVLTKLPNRRAFEYQLAKRMEAPRSEGTTLAALLVDLRDLKGINHRHGMHIADKVLVYMGRLIQRTLRVDDYTFTARFAGDEFGIILELDQGGFEGVHRIAERIHEALTGVYRSRDGVEIPISVSIGGCLIHDETSLKGLYGRVARNLEDAKEISYHGSEPVPIVITQ